LGLLRASSYLNQIEVENGTSLIYNGSTLCMDLVPTEYGQLLAEGAGLDFLSPEEKEHLEARGHLTSLTPEEEEAAFRKALHEITGKVAEAGSKQRKASLTFVLTYNCNLACSYCFQSELPQALRRHVMTAEFVDAFFRDCFPQLYPAPLSSCLFTLFGGEPLLPGNREAINRILAHASEIPSSRVNVATNATNLQSMLDLFGPDKDKIQSVQITLDGDRDFHDQNRVSTARKPTFDAMIGSVRQVIEARGDVAIRVHLHPNRLKSAELLAQYLDREGLLGNPRIYVYFQPLNDFTMDKYTPEDLEIFRRTFQLIAAKTGRPPSHLMHLNGFLEMQQEKELPTIRYCGLGSAGFWVVDPLGDIYQCYDESGCRDRRVGTFFEGRLECFPLKEEYTGRQLLNLPECVQCSVSLFCGGGCPVRARSTVGSIFKPYCQQNKEFVAQTLKAFFLRNAAKNAANREAEHLALA
jgi:uncharacterized protein